MALLTSPSIAGLIIIAATIYHAFVMCRVLCSARDFCFLFQLPILQQLYETGTIISPILQRKKCGLREVSGLHKVTGLIGRFKARPSDVKAMLLSDLCKRRIE